MPAICQECLQMKLKTLNFFVKIRLHLLLCLTVCFSEADLLAADLPRPTSVGIQYQGHIYTHYQDISRIDKPYILLVEPIATNKIRTSFILPFGNRNAFESLFIRDRRLIYGGKADQLGNLECTALDRAYCLSADKVQDAKLVYLQSDGTQFVISEGTATPTLWWRETAGCFSANKPNSTQIFHTALAPFGARDLLVFDLFISNRSEGDTASHSKVHVTRMIPEEVLKPNMPGKPKLVHHDDIRSAFDEPFQACIIKEDYYFLTKTGAIYHSPMPTDGKKRSMTEWSNRKSTHVYLITDADTANTHYIVMRDELGWHFSILAPTPSFEILYKFNMRSNVDTPEQIVTIKNMYNLIAAKK